ncbi:MBL fold metallo-hydrolase [Acidiferrimicrobium sp. IK]|uniref:MBL fold metallo-hydrolase n=1 Tax=Acidiferrimicrobium sp. IK TaxID=2871700 RepID=UPI0021CB2478|nr:MBL fold metallo-hydrolase [Acidiferrimicrobium sp. IK]MCU4185906.1 MBL fold metallo-hydrolase [Acidiferrimicrobium sp. IK]
MSGEDWAAPGVHEVAAGVFRVPLPLPTDGLRAVNIYVIVDAGRLVCIDSGWAVPEARKVLDAALASLGCSVADIDRFLVTHAHRDHYTTAVSLRRSEGTAVSLGAGERPSLDAIADPDHRPFEDQLSALRRYGAAHLAKLVRAEMVGGPDTQRSEWEPPDTWLDEGDIVLGSGRRLGVVETPGHTRGHVVFTDPANRLLFAGDHVLPTITPSIGLEPVASDNPLGDFLRSLARVRRLPDAMLLPAHGPVAPSVHARIDQLVDHHGRRLEQTLDALAAGATSVFEVAARLSWTRRQRTLAELDLFNQMLAVTETAAHLRVLVAQQRVDQVLDDGIYRYSSLP